MSQASWSLPGGVRREWSQLAECGWPPMTPGWPLSGPWERRGWTWAAFPWGHSGRWANERPLNRTPALTLSSATSLSLSLSLATSLCLSRSLSLPLSWHLSFSVSLLHSLHFSLTLSLYLRGYLLLIDDGLKVWSFSSSLTTFNCHLKRASGLVC